MESASNSIQDYPEETFYEDESNEIPNELLIELQLNQPIDGAVDEGQFIYYKIINKDKDKLVIFK